MIQSLPTPNSLSAITQIIGMAEIYHEDNKTAKLCRVLSGYPDMQDKGLGKKSYDCY